MNKIKKFTMPFIAIVIAAALVFGASAFKPLKPFSTTTMYYHGGSFLQADVQTKSNWTTSSQSCPNGTAKACSVDVPDDIVSGGSFISTVSLEGTAGNPSALSAVKNSGNNVSGVTIHNKPN
ncbi:MAG TPA: DUF6520 family protein [Parafilimonas sp.]|nr:DUF6520 family protein [Parafilimonas sp.]